MSVTIQIPVTITIPEGAPVCCCGEEEDCPCPGFEWYDTCIHWQVGYSMGISGLDGICPCAGPGPDYVIGGLPDLGTPYGISDVMLGTCPAAFSIFISCVEGSWILEVRNDCIPGGLLVAVKVRTAADPYPWGDYTVTEGGSGTVKIWPPVAWTPVEGCNRCHSILSPD